MAMNGPKCIILVGFPASGKSTLRAKIVEKYPHLFVLSTDDKIEELSAAEGLTYSQGFEKHIKYAEGFYNGSLDGCIHERRDFIVDRTNLTTKSRRRILSRLPKDYKKMVIWVRTPNNMITSRLDQRGWDKFIPEASLLDMAKRFQMPALTEGFDDIWIASGEA